MIGDRQRLGGILLDHQDGGTGGVDALYEREDLAAVLGAQAGGRLIEQQESWLQHQRLAERQHLALAAR